jgi:hypothetical protein
MDILLFGMVLAYAALITVTHHYGTKGVLLYTVAIFIWAGILFFYNRARRRK